MKEKYGSPKRLNEWRVREYWMLRGDNSSLKVI